MSCDETDIESGSATVWSRTTSQRPKVVRSVADLRAIVARWHRDGDRVGLVPTMGALHAGHLSLIQAIAPEVDRIIVSIFVNPTQFGPGEDYDSYPRAEADDLDKLAATPAELVYIPPVSEMYPEGFATRIQLAGPAEDLEGAHRPGHFDGAATVVVKLFQQSQCGAAIFGEKDYQQLIVLRRVAADLDIPVRILAAPIVREVDGLAASSRNAYLDAEERKTALALPNTLFDCKACAEAGESLSELEASGQAALLEAGFDGVDYLTFRDADSLAPVKRLSGHVRLLAAARIAGTRLIDNVAVGNREGAS